MPDSLGDRMKRYENCYRIELPRRMPVIVRIDGRAFHTFTRGFQKPFDNLMVRTMQHVALDLAKEVAGCKLAYVQSDEISLLVTNNDTITTEPWFSNGLQKLVSITASIATRSFNNQFKSYATTYIHDRFCTTNSDDELRLMESYRKGINNATFDSRAFVLPNDEVANYFLWRQQDATRNSIEACAQSMFSHKRLQGKNCDKLQDMMFKENGFNWNELPIALRRGSCVVKDDESGEWTIDQTIPIFSKERFYIERFLLSAEERMNANG